MQPLKYLETISRSLIGVGRSAALAVVLCIAAPSLAGTLQDAAAAIDRGEDGAAKRLLLPLAGTGNGRAQSMLGILLYKSAKTKSDYTASLSWIRKSAALGDAVGEAFLGTMLNEGKVIPKNTAEAIQWFQKAAAQGDADAEAALGVVYTMGIDAPQNCLQGMKWLEMSAAQGNADGEYLLGLAYGKGKCTDQDFTKANKWFRLAAEQGNAASQCMLGFAYASGRAVAQDPIQALKWYILAAAQAPGSQDNPDAALLRDVAIKGRDALAAQLTPAQVSEAQQLARSSVPRSVPHPVSQLNTQPWGVHSFRLGASETLTSAAARQRFAATEEAPRTSQFPIGNGRVAESIEAGSKHCYFGDVSACELYRLNFSQPEAGGGLMRLELEESFGRSAVATETIVSNLRSAYGAEQRNQQLVGINSMGMPALTKLVWSRRPIPKAYNPDVDSAPADLAENINGGEIVIVVLMHLKNDKKKVQGLRLLAVDLDSAKITAGVLSGGKKVDPTF